MRNKNFKLEINTSDLHLFEDFLQTYDEALRAAKNISALFNRNELPQAKSLSGLVGRVFMTGGTGSLGTAILARAEKENWDCEFTIFSRGESKQAQTKKTFPQHNFVLGDVAKERDVMRAMRGHNIVLHLAAYKQVPSAQANVPATIETNVIGSQNIVDTAIMYGVEHVIASSTDKACAPVNAYGASKYLMECIFQNASRQKTPTQFHLARYGNVICSNASVIPLFLRQKQAGGPLTVTHREMTRFWITLEDAVDLILKAKAVDMQEQDQNAKCAVVVPKAGAMSVFDLAKLIAGPDIPIEITGIRPGEKVHEAMVHPAESFYTADMGDYFLIYPPTSGRVLHDTPWKYTSDIAPIISDDKMLDMIKDYV